MGLRLSEARERVAKGAAHLDVVRPGWFNRIDTGTLTLDDPCGCIVGQLCGAWNLTAMGLRPMPEYGSVLDASRDAVTHGLDLTLAELCDGTSASRVEKYQPLQDAWIEAIAARKFPVQESIPVSPETVPA